jgi:hypothetical protein
MNYERKNTNKITGKIKKAVEANRLVKGKKVKLSL